MSAGTDIKTWEDRADAEHGFLPGDAWKTVYMLAEIAELRAALEAAEQFEIPPASGESPCIEDRDGIPAAIRMVIQSRGSYGALRSLYRLINIGNYILDWTRL